MIKKVFILSMILSGLLIVIVAIPTLGADFTGNKCFDEWTWCNEGTDDQNAYWWEAGWCAAAIDAGIIGGTIESCTSTPDDDYVEPVVEDDDDDDKKKKAKVEYCQVYSDPTYHLYTLDGWNNGLHPIDSGPGSFEYDTCPK